MKILDLLTDITLWLEQEQNKPKTFNIVQVNGVNIYFTKFEYCVETKSVHFYNDNVLTATIWNSNLVKYRIVY